jgi:transcriptional regulator with XRE-family HTH domain
MRNVALENAITASGYRRGWLCEQLKVHPNSLSRWVAEGRVPHRGTRDRLAELLEVPPEQLFPHLTTTEA